MKTLSSNPIRQLSPEERPRERCLKHGPETLSLRECLAVILSPGPPGIGALGLARRVLELRASEGSEPLPEHAETERAFFSQLESRGDPFSGAIPGLGDANRARLLAVFELARRYHSFCSARLVGAQPSSSHSLLAARAQAHRLTAHSRIPPERLTDPREWLGFVPLLGSRDVGPFCLVERGSRTHVNVEPAELFARILQLRPRGIWLFHNHPSGLTEPSEDDLELTRNVAELCRPFSIELLGHGIIARCEAHWIPLGRKRADLP